MWTTTISDMNFRFSIGKATEAGCLFLERAGGRMNIMKLVKLMFREMDTPLSRWSKSAWRSVKRRRKFSGSVRKRSR